MTNNQLLLVSLLFSLFGIYLFWQTRKISRSFKEKPKDDDYSNLVWIIAIILFIILYIPWLYTSTIFGGYGDKSNEIGDTIGGITSPFINGLSAVLVYFALRAQIDANKLVNDQFKIQQIDTRFFELIKLHRDNVSEIGIGRDSGKKVFVLILREYREALKIAKREGNACNAGYSQKEYLEIAYYILFYGVGPNSSRQLKKALSDLDPIYIENLLYVLNLQRTKDKIKEKRQFEFTPFEGHQSRLGHYYRHLYHTVTYIHQQKIVDDKYSYVKTLRAQLTTHEQALLYLNSLTSMGKNWWKDRLIEKYKLVKNIPNHFFNPETEINLENEFEEGYFEHQKE